MYELVLEVNSQKQKHSESTVAMCCFLIFGSSLVIGHMTWTLKVLQAVSRPLSLRMKPINRQLRKNIPLLNDDLLNREYENVGLQGKIRVKYQQIATLKRRYVGYLSDEDKNNSMSIIAKNNEEEEYPYISICGKHGYRRHEARVLLVCNPGSTLFAD